MTNAGVTKKKKKCFFYLFFYLICIINESNNIINFRSYNYQNIVLNNLPRRYITLVNTLLYNIVYR